MTEPSTNEKYEFTGETKDWYGVTLRQIRAKVATGVIAAGTIGGWIQSETNLSVYGNAWVSGNARVSGNAQVYGDARVSGNAWVSGNARVYGDARVSGNAQVYGNAQVSPLVVIGLYYPVTIIDRHMQIGCEFHLIAEWSEFDDRRIAAMDGANASRFWRDYGPLLLGMAKASGRPFAEAGERPKTNQAAA